MYGPQEEQLFLHSKSSSSHVSIVLHATFQVQFACSVGLDHQVAYLVSYYI